MFVRTVYFKDGRGYVSVEDGRNDHPNGRYQGQMLSFWGVTRRIEQELLALVGRTVPYTVLRNMIRSHGTPNRSDQTLVPIV